MPFWNGVYAGIVIGIALGIWISYGLIQLGGWYASRTSTNS